MTEAQIMGIIIIVSIVFLIGIAIYGLIICPIQKYVRKTKLLNSKFNAYYDSHMRYLQNAIANVAHTNTYDYFIKYRKPIETKSGEFRQDFIKAREQEHIRIEKIVFKNELADFEEYIVTRYRSEILVRQLESVLNDFVDEYDNKVNRLSEGQDELKDISPDVFFSLYEKKPIEFIGVYVLHNENKDMYYVGQAKRIFQRVNQHFTGSGNGDVYADYKYGDTFTITLLPFANSGYTSLDLYEKHMIERFDAYYNGYNKNMGNS